MPHDQVFTTACLKYSRSVYTGCARVPLQVPPPILGYRHHPLEYFLTYDGFMYNEPQVSFSNRNCVASFQAVCNCLCQGLVNAVYCACNVHMCVCIFKALRARAP